MAAGDLKMAIALHIERGGARFRHAMRELFALRLSLLFASRTKVEIGGMNGPGGMMGILWMRIGEIVRRLGFYESSEFALLGPCRLSSSAIAWNSLYCRLKANFASGCSDTMRAGVCHHDDGKSTPLTNRHIVARLFALCTTRYMRSALSVLFSLLFLF